MKGQFVSGFAAPLGGRARPPPGSRPTRMLPPL